MPMLQLIPTCAGSGKGRSSAARIRSGEQIRLVGWPEPALDDGELVAAEARAKCSARRTEAPQPLRDLDQQSSPAGWPKVVDRLERVEIDAQDRDRLADRRRGDRIGEQIGEDGAVGQAGQRVVIGEVGDPLRRFLALADVAHGEHAHRRRARRAGAAAPRPAGRCRRRDQPAFGAPWRAADRKRFEIDLEIGQEVGERSGTKSALAKPAI
jgi:hypothetical protein